MANLLRERLWSDMDPLLRLDATGNVRKVRGTDCIAQSITSILRTLRFSRVRTDIGSNLFRILFEPISEETAEDIKFVIENTIPTYDNRIGSINATVIPFENDEYYEIRIRFSERDSLSYEEIITFLDGRVTE